MTQLIKKLSAKSIIGNVRQLAAATFYEGGIIGKEKKDAPTEVKLYSLIGIVKGLKSDDSDFGKWVSFEGDFKATRIIDGEIFRGPRAFISEPAQSMLETALENHDTIEMAFIISLIPSNNLLGYEYRTSPLIEPKENDGILSLEKSLGDKLKLPAPTQEKPTKPAPKKKGE